ncbi:MAG: recombinase family protein, partial [Actinobacteria bacterium]|nr:recombinase family protein [Actinomycetota bacterium]
VNGWLGELFARDNIDRTVTALIASQELTGNQRGTSEAAKKRLGEAETRLRRFQAAIEAGVDPAALVDAINEAQAARAAARAELDNTPAPNTLSAAEVYVMVDALGDVGEALSGARPESLANLYQAVDLQVRYEPSTHVADVTIRPGSRVNSECVRGGT